MTRTLRNLKEAREVFRGSAREGALMFPESINVAAAVSLAGVGLDQTGEFERWRAAGCDSYGARGRPYPV